MVVGVSSGEGRVPSALPPLLKNYTKAAIRTQPRDLLAWSHAYFSALCSGETPPVKEQLEFPLPDTPSWITPGLLRVLHKKLGSKDLIGKNELEDLCNAFSIEEEVMKKAWEAAPKEEGNEDERKWKSVLVGLVSQSEEGTCEQLSALMYASSEELLTKKTPVDEVLGFLKELPKDDIKDEQEVIEFLQEVASFQDNYLYPADLTRPSCPFGDK